MSAKILGNMNFRLAHGYNNNDNNDNNYRRTNNNNLELNAGERGASPSSLPASPSIPIPERKFTAEEVAVMYKFVDYIRIQNVNEKPKLTPAEKKILRGMYWSRQFIDKVLRRLKYLGMRKESANLEKNYINMVKSRKSRAKTRKHQRKTRKL